MLTKEQRWMNRLKKCLTEMPEGCELLVNSDTGTASSLYLLNEEGFERSLDANGGDCIGIDWESELVVDRVFVKRVIANSESY